MNLLKKYKLAVIGAIIGSGLGYLYYAQVGCVSGTCAITSSPINSTLYGALLGYLFVGMFTQKDKKQES